MKKMAVEKVADKSDFQSIDMKSLKKSIMQSREEAIANGLLIPDESTCVKCHNSEAPTFKGFDFKEKWEKIKHPTPK